MCSEWWQEWEAEKHLPWFVRQHVLLRTAQCRTVPFPISAATDSHSAASTEEGQLSLSPWYPSQFLLCNGLALLWKLLFLMGEWDWRWVCLVLSEPWISRLGHHYGNSPSFSSSEWLGRPSLCWTPSVCRDGCDCSSIKQVNLWKDVWSCAVQPECLLPFLRVKMMSWPCRESYLL